MAGFGSIKRFPSPGYEVWEDWREYYLDVCEVFMWTEEEVKRYLPEKLCDWALDSLNYLPHKFWKTDQRNRAWTLQETLYFFDLRLSNNPQFYEDAFERYLIEKEEYEEAVLQCEIDRPVFQSDVVDGEELQRQERTPTSDRKKDVQVKTDIIVKSVMTKKPAKISSTKGWSAIKAVGFGVKAVLEEKPDVRDGRQRSISKLNDRLSGAETVEVNDSSQNFVYDGETEKQITTKPKSENEQFKKMMDLCIARWDNSKKTKIAEQRNEALEEIEFSELEDDATFIHDDFSDEDSFFESDDEDKFYCMDNDVFLPNIRGRHSSSDSFVSTPGNELTVGKRCSSRLITLEEITSGPGVPWHFGKWIDVGETAMPHFSVAQKGELAIAAENIVSGILIANNLRQGIVSTGSQDTDQLSLTRTSEDNCEKLQGSFVSFPTDVADSEATKSCGSKAAKANTDGFLEESKEKKSTTPAKSGGNFFSENWKVNAVDETDKNEKEDSKSFVTAVGCGNTIEEEITSFGTSLQLVPVIFRKLDDESFDAEIAAAGETVICDVCDHSTAEDLVKSEAFINGQDGSGDGSGDVVCGLVQMNLEEPDRKKKCSLNSEAQLLHSDEKKLERSFSYAANDGTPQSNHFERSAVEQSLMLGQGSVFTPEEILFRKYSTSESDCEVLHIQKGEFGDDKSVSLSKENDLGLKIQKDGKKDCAFDSGENVVPVQFEISYSKQDNKREQSSDFEVKKAIETDWNQFSIGLSGQEETIKYRRKVSCSSSPSLLRGSDDQRSLELEYTELCILLFGKQIIGRKEKWNKLNLKSQLSRGVWCKRKKRSKNENGGGHPFKHRRKKAALTKLVKLNCLM